MHEKNMGTTFEAFLHFFSNVKCSSDIEGKNISSHIYDKVDCHFSTSIYYFLLSRSHLIIHYQFERARNA
jgi:hypothetical protein